jgi:hypothetical protein
MKVASDVSVLMDTPQFAAGLEIKCAVQELLEAGLSLEDRDAIDVAVSTLLEIAPHLKDADINVDGIVKSIQGS